MVPEIVYEDRDLLVCVKPVGCLSEDGPTENCMPKLLAARYREAGKPDFIAGVHRLDRNVGGLMVFSRKKQITGKLTAAVAEHRVTKEYLAVLRGHIEEKEGILQDLLFRDSTKNKTYVVKRMRKGVRDASLAYRVLAKTDTLTLVRVRLHTGRTHQIRAQFSSRGLPLLGDIRYGSKDPACDCALWSFHLAFSHPSTGKQVDLLRRPPDAYPWNLFPAELLTGGSGEPLPDRPIAEQS
ncbi:MAG: RluA family pseudouridine synthase [Oscillospiraceae bacterium]|nr:RluA family pseudouridine synthase [Oscillospiraceae bacterium]